MGLSRETALENTKNMIMGRLDKFENYEERHKFLTTGTVKSPKGKQISIKSMITHFPEFEKYVNDYMLGNAIGEMGNPEDSAYTFSKDVSDLALKESFSRLYPEGQVIGGGIKETQSKYEQEYLDESGEWLETTNELKERKKNLKTSITKQRDEFDDRATFFPGSVPVLPWWSRDENEPDDAAIIDKYNLDPVELPIPFGSHYTRELGGKYHPFDPRGLALQSVGALADVSLGVTMPAAAGASQLAASWWDMFFAEEGMEKIETRRFMWDPEREQYGIPPKLKATQDKLSSVLQALDYLKGESDHGLYLKKRNAELDADIKIYSDSILDDLIDAGYATPSQVLDKLEAGSSQFKE